MGMYDQIDNSDKSNELINSKLLERPRISELLLQAISYPLVKIVADAGFGKTCAISNFLKGVEIKSYWISLTELDDLTHRFWESFVRSVCVSDHELAAEMVNMGFPESHVAFELMSKMLTRIFPPGQKVLIILDDFHLIQNESIVHFVERLMRENSSSISIVLSSRNEPVIDNFSLTAKGFCFSISGMELSFTENEMRDYFKLNKIILQDAELKYLAGYTGGWPIAIYLVGLHVKKYGAPLHGYESTIGQDLFALIDRDIYQRYDIRTREYLVAISILSGFEPKLVSAVTAYKRDVLAGLVSTTLFIRKSINSDEYTIHHLLLQFLKEKFLMLDEAKQTRYHMRAAKWYSDNDRVFEAVDHYKSCFKYDKMLDVLERSPENVSTADKCKWVIEIIESMPEKVIERRLVTQVGYGGLLFMAGRFAEAKNQLDIVIQKSENMIFKTPIIHNLVMGEVYMLDGIISYFTKNKDFVSSFKKAAKSIPGGSRLLNEKIPFTLGNPSMFIVFDDCDGEVDRIQSMLTEAAPYTMRVLHGANSGFDVLFGAETAYYRGNFLLAEQLATKCIHLSKQFSQHTIELDADFVLLQTYMARGEKNKVADILGKMKRKATVLNDPLFSTMVSIMYSWSCVVTGNLDDVSAWIKDGDMASGENLGIGAWMEHFLHARILLAQKNYYALEAFLPVLDFICVKRQGFLLNRIEYNILAALLAFGYQDIDGAEKALLKVYELTYRNNLVMPVASYGGVMKKLLSAIKKSNTSIADDWISLMITLSGDFDKATMDYDSQVDTAFGLTPKELVVLEQLCSGMSNQEVGKRLNMKENTVKWYVNQIISKMGVKNRTEAALEAVRRNVFK